MNGSGGNMVFAVIASLLLGQIGSVAAGTDSLQEEWKSYGLPDGHADGQEN